MQREVADRYSWTGALSLRRPIWHTLALCFGGLLAYRRGRISQAVTDERQAISILEGEHNAIARAYATAFLAHALIDSGNLELAADRLDALPLTDPAQLAPTPIAVAARGRLRLLQGDPEGALSHQLRVESPAGMERLSPAVVSWRSQAALALMALDRGQKQGQLTTEDVELSRQSGSAWAQGLGLHCTGLAAAGADGIALLEQAAERLQSIGADTEHPNVLIDLGSLADPAGASREQATDRLGQGLDLSCDAAGGPPTATPLRESGWRSAVYSPTGSFVVLASPGTTSEETRGCGREPNARLGSRRPWLRILWLVGQRWQRRPVWRWVSPAHQIPLRRIRRLARSHRLRLDRNPARRGATVVGLA